VYSKTTYIIKKIDLLFYCNVINIYMKRLIMNNLKRIPRDYYLEYKGKTRFASAIEEDEYDKITPNKCNKCNIIKTRADFNNNTCGSLPFENLLNNDGIRYKRGECKVCSKKDSKGKNAAIKKAKAMGMDTKAPEGTKCEICDNQNKIVFDHCHDSLIFRGWLCDPCNRSLGILGDDVTSLLGVLNYLNRIEQKTIEQDFISNKLIDIPKEVGILLHDSENKNDIVKENNIYPYFN